MIYASSKRNFTDTQKETIWQLWSYGKSLSEIGRSIGKHADSVFCFLQKTCGIKPTPLSRAKSALTILDREEYLVKFLLIYLLDTLHEI